MSDRTQRLVDVGFSARRADALEADFGDATDITFTPTGGIAATTVSTALAELDTEKLAASQYATGTWTPVLTFATPGDLSVVYSVQAGIYTAIGRIVIAPFAIVTSTFTHTTSSGNCQITGLPFAIGSFGNLRGPLIWQGITKAGYTDISCNVTSSMLTLTASGSGVSNSSVAAADMPTAGTVILGGTAIYFT